MKPQKLNSQKIKLIIASTIGNILELYDFTLYGTLSLIIAKNFFSKDEYGMSLLITLSVFGAGFLMRPLGAIFFGYLGDHIGRKKALAFSIILMAISTFIIGIIPPYSIVGIFAPITLVCCRLMQGLSMGAEFSGSSIFLIEHFNFKRKGFAGGLILASAVIGALLATCAGFLSIQEGMPHWAWRIPFLIGGISAIAGFYIRTHLKESPEFQKILNLHQKQKFPLKIALKNYAPGCLCAIGISAYGGAIAYLLAAFMNVYLSSILNLKIQQSLLLTSMGLLCNGLAGILSGYLADRYGVRKIMLGASMFCIILAIPAFTLMQTNCIINIFLAVCFLGVFSGSFCGPQLTLISSLFPTNIRYSAASFCYCIGLMTVGGTFPLIATFLIQKTNSLLSPAFYIIVCAILGFFSVFISKRYQISEA